MCYTKLPKVVSIAFCFGLTLIATIGSVSLKSTKHSSKSVGQREQIIGYGAVLVVERSTANDQWGCYFFKGKITNAQKEHSKIRQELLLVKRKDSLSKWYGYIQIVEIYGVLKENSFFFFLFSLLKNIVNG